MNTLKIYIYLSLINGLLLFSTMVSAKPTFHAIIITEHDVAIGSVRDSIRVNAEVRLIAEMGEMELKVKNFGRYDLGIGDYMTNLSVDTNDVIMFYYTGHGGNNQSDNYVSDYPEFDNSELTFKAEKVYKKLKLKNARLTFVFYDCCNHRVYGTLPGTRTGVGRALPSSAQVLLFRNAKGSVLLASSQLGEYSKGTALIGGFATDGFFRAIRQVKFRTEEEQQNIWDNVLTKMVDNTHEMNTRQTPIYKNEITTIEVDASVNQIHAAPTKKFGKTKDW